MAVSIDTVYQRVLAILNKEQRGYITPTEFNLLANQAQMSIFEQYFYDINQFSRIPGNDTEYSDMLNTLNEKIEIFETSTTFSHSNQVFTIPSSVYKLGSLYLQNTTTEIERVTPKEYKRIASSPLTEPSESYPVAVVNNSNVRVYGKTFDVGVKIDANYIKNQLRLSGVTPLY